MVFRLLQVVIQSKETAMTGREFIRLVKEMRRVQSDYNKTGNMKLRGMMPKLEKRVDAAIIDFEMRWEKEQPKQMTLTELFDVKPLKQNDNEYRKICYVSGKYARSADHLFQDQKQKCVSTCSNTGGIV